MTKAAELAKIVDASGNIVTSGTVEPAGDTAAGDNAAIGFTSAEGIVITGQGSTNDVTIKNDADADVIEIPTGTTNVTVAGTLTATGFIIGSADINENDLESIDGITAGTVAASKAAIVDTNKDITGFRNITLTGELDAATLDISGDADIDGTLEADAITVNGTALNTVIAGVTVANATLAATTTVTNSTANTNFPVVFHDESNALLDDTGALRYNPSTGELLVPKLTVAGVTTTADTVTMQAANAVVFEGATADAHETTLTITDPTADRTITLPNVSGTLPILAADSNTAITSTPAELNILDGATVVVGEINALDLGSTAVGTAIASKAVILDSNKDYTGIRNFTTTGVVTSNAGVVVDNITIDGTEIDLSSGDLTVDVAGNIKLDADGGDIRLLDGGTQFGVLQNNSTDFVIQCSASAKDLIFKGNDSGGSAVTALTIDMSDAGTAIFNHDVRLGTDGAILNIGNDNDLKITHNGTDGDFESAGTLTFDVASNIILDADGGDIFLKDGGTSIGQIALNNSGYLDIYSAVQDADFRVRGNDGGSTVTALRIDMSAAGAAIFNNDVTAFSDRRLKTDIEPIKNALPKVMRMQGVYYKRNDIENAKEQIGVIAQDMEAIVPEVVLTADDEMQTKSVDYGKLCAVLIESIKDLKAEIDELKRI
jgi:hypothetical protein